MRFVHNCGSYSPCSNHVSYTQIVQHGLVIELVLPVPGKCVEMETDDDTKSPTTIGNYCQPAFPFKESFKCATEKQDNAAKIKALCPGWVQIHKDHAMCRRCKPLKRKVRTPCRWILKYVNRHVRGCRDCANSGTNTAL
jgi:hypothetical protein